MKVLSLFDGISCGLVALKNLGIPVEEYHAFEINPASIFISGRNHPEVKRYGDVLTADYTQFKDIDLLMGGSPCQDLSITKSKTREGLKGDKSSLFWNYVEALNTVKPKYFLFENVASMDKQDKDVISQALGCQPIKINASSFLPQNRERLFWTNIRADLPSGFTSKRFIDLAEDNVKDKYYYNKPFRLFDAEDKNILGEIELKTYESNRRVFNPNGIIGCLTCVSGGYQEKKVYDAGKNQVRKITPKEYERLQGLPDDYTSGVCDGKRYSACGNGWCVPVIEYILTPLKDDDDG